jgi:CRISPR-associated protein Cmr1
MRKFTVEIKPLTPIWTGDADRKVTTLRETGIIGSLRWWYEALIRGYGGFACNPTGTEERLKCKLDEKKFKELLKSEKSIKKALDRSGICSACQLFGCTGWSRRFRLEVDYKEEKVPLFFVSSHQNKNWLHKITEGQNEILWSKDPIKLNFIPMNNDKDFELEDIIKALIFIISRYGGLGAKLQYGFGQFNVDIDKMTTKNGVQLIKNNINKEKDKNLNQISFLDFFMLKFRILINYFF